MVDIVDDFPDIKKRLLGDNWWAPAKNVEVPPTDLLCGAVEDIITAGEVVAKKGLRKFPIVGAPFSLSAVEAEARIRAYEKFPIVQLYPLHWLKNPVKLPERAPYKLGGDPCDLPCMLRNQDNILSAK